MADLEGALDSVWREGALYKLHMAGINNISWLFFPAFSQTVCRNLVNSFQCPWLETQLGVPQSSLLSPLIFLVYTSDLTPKEEKPQSQVKLSKPQESKCADDIEFWRTHKNYYQLLINIQLAIVNLQSWFYKWCISLNISKTNYMVFYNKKKKPSPPSIPITINEIPLKQVQTKRVLGLWLMKISHLLVTLKTSQ